MPITTKTAAALLAIFVTLLAGAWIIMERTVLPGFQRLEANNHAADRARVEANLSGMREELRARVVDYARWDDAYAFINGANPDFAETNFYPQWFEDYGVDVVIVVDDRARVVWAGERTGDGELKTPNAAFALALVAQAGRTLPAEVGEGIVWNAEAPLLIAAARISGNEGALPPRGHLIFGKRMSVTELRQQTQLDLALAGPQAPEMAAHMSALVHADGASWTTPDGLFSLIALRATNGDLVGAVLAQRPRDLTALGMQSIHTALLLFATMSAVAVVALWVLLRGMVIARVVRLQRHIDAQREEAAPMPHKQSHGHDEIARLTDAYNSLVQRLHETAAREQHANLEREAAAAANRMKSDFLANISHELRTPLDSVIGYAELIDEELEVNGFDASRLDLRRITLSARHLLALINEILDLSKLEAGRLEVTPEAFRVDEMVQGALNAVASLAREHGDTLDVSIDPNVGTAYSDQNRLRQCLINVLSNACRLTDNGRVALRAQRVRIGGREMLRFEVRDTSAGMSARDLERAFEPFIHTERSSYQIGGAGLGLAITRKLMELLGGRVEASSTPGCGVTIVLTAPVLFDDFSEAAADDQDDVRAA